jgi:hypothetical protein
MGDNWHDLPEEMRERRPPAEQAFHEVRELGSVEKVQEELEFALEDLEDIRQESARNLEHHQLRVHALQLRLVELRQQRA